MINIKNRLKAFATRKQATILTYHSVIPSPLKFTVATHICAQRFEKHIQHIAQNYHCVTLSTLLAHTRNNTIEPGTLAITFDDGFYNNFSCALPILEKYNIPATIFIATGYINRKELLWPETLATLLVLSTKTETLVDGNPHAMVTAEEKAATYRSITQFFKKLSSEEIENTILDMFDQHNITLQDIVISPYYDYFRVLNWHELQELAKSPLISIGSHTINHLRLQNTSESQALDEIRNSRIMLEDKVGETVYFAYPFGGYGTDYSNRHVAMVKEAGYLAAVTTSPRMVTSNADYYQLPRSSIDAAQSTSSLDYILSGGPLFAQGISPQNIIKGVLTGKTD